MTRSLAIWLVLVAACQAAEEPTLVDLIGQGAEQAAALIAALDKASELSAAELAALRKLDDQLNAARPLPNEALELAILRALALSDEPASLGQLHEVFETFPERRHLVAVALAAYTERHRRRAEDWRLLVRSLNVVTGEHARAVLRALRRHADRATKPRWVRQVILIGLRLGEPGTDDATELLRHWTGANPAMPTDPGPKQLAAWQKWFAAKHPEEPDPKLPADPPIAKRKFADLAKFLHTPAGLAGDAQRGAVVFEKAQCHKCHRVRGRGETLGPDLTETAGRFQRRELLEAILFPSEYISDQYQTVNLLTRDGKSLSGVSGPGPRADVLVVLQANGEKVQLRKADIEASQTSKQSAMPVGALEPLSEREIADLFAYILSARQ